MTTIILLVLSAAATTVEAPIDTVTVFSDRAEVRRQTVALCGGRETVTMAFPALPPKLDRRTLRAEAEAPAEVVGVVARLAAAEAPLDAEVAAIREDLQRIDDARAALDHRLRQAEARSSAAEAYATYLRALLREAARGEEADMRSWSEALDVMQAERMRIGTERLEVAAERRELDRRADLLGRRLAARQRALGDSPERAYQVGVTVDCNGAGRAPISLSYVVPGASWSPEYDLRFDASGGDGVGEGTARITVGAVVRQATGEDWESARVSLTTARPRLGAEAPVPAPIYVDGREVGKERVLVQDAEDRRSLPSAAGDAAASPPGQARLDDGGRAFSLTLPDSVDVRGDGRPYRFPVDVTEAPAMGQRVSIPKLAPYVYRVVRLDNPAAFPLLEGPMHVFRDGSYAGRIALEYTAPGAPMEISLGPDDTVRVRRHEIAETDRSPAFLRRTRTMERAYRIELENGAAGPVTVELRESIPVSRMDDVRVTLDRERTTAGYTLDEERGILSWVVNLPREDRAEVDVGFGVRLPDDWEVASAR